jgi:zinc protease
MLVPYTKRILPNGLHVIAHEDHHTPLVAVSVWYHVGSKNESPGRTGFAHLFEHLMFEGSAHHDGGYFPPLQEAGGAVNGSTNADRTNYWETVPAGAVERALWMEADRMGWLLPALSPSRFDTQRDVVLNERRQSYENRPYGLAQFVMLAALYPEDHPYHWPTIGHPDDLRAATVDDAREFFTRFYHPGNASLAIAGDIAPEQAFELAERYFGEIAGGDHVSRVTAPPPPAGRERRVVVEDRVELARLYLSWPSPALFAPDDAELDLVADLIANGRTSRLYRQLVHERRIATELGGSQSSRELGGAFQLVATAAPGQALDDLRRAIGEAIAEFCASGPTSDELDRGRAQTEAAFIYRLATLGGFGGKSDQLNAYNVFCGTPGFFDQDLRRYVQATPASLQAAAQRWIAMPPAVALSVVPHGRRTLALPGSSLWQPR